MSRHLFNILSAISLLLCVAVGFVWVRSYSHCDYLWLRTSPPAPV